MTEWESDPEAAAAADVFWQRVLQGDAAFCGYHHEGRCVLAGRPCAEAIKDGKEKRGPSSKWCVFAPAED